MDSINYDFVVKPIVDSSGRGILVFEYQGGHFFGNKKLWRKGDLWNVVAEGENLLEEKVSQMKQLSNIYPPSVNTLRITTIKTDDNVWHMARAFLRVGKDGRQVDNIGAGGILIGIDNHGKSFYAYNHAENKEITHHPDTGVPRKSSPTSRRSGRRPQSSRGPSGCRRGRRRS